MSENMFKTLITEAEIQAKVKQLGAEISRDYAEKKPVLIGVLKGCFVFMADLIRQMDIPLSVDFLVVSSYEGRTKTSGTVKILKDLSCSVENQHVILVEDILDSGHTLAYLKEYLECSKPASVKIVALLDKPDRREVEIAADYVGFSCPDEFVVGYGLDKAEYWRNLPYIGALQNDE